MPIGHSKAMWQCEWHNLEANFGTKQCKWRHLMTKFWTNLGQIRMCKFKRNTNLISRNIAHLKFRNTITSQSRFSGQREQTLSTCVLILISSWRGWTCSCTPLNPSSGTWSTLLYQNDSIHHQAEIQSGEACVLTKEDMSSSFSNFAIMVLDVNFINPYETAGFLFFNDKKDAKKTANSVVKLKGCLIDVHVDINNLPPFPRDHQIQIKL